MSIPACCQYRVGRTKAAEPPLRTRRFLQLVGSLAPGALAALIPKCPACIAAYLAVGTGLGVSATTATALRSVLIVLCLASSFWLLLRVWRPFAGKNLANLIRSQQ